ncbi:potassium channel protein [soil metagenome]
MAKRPHKREHLLHRLLRWPDRMLRHWLPRRLRRMLFVPLGILVVGTVAYPTIEGPPWTYFDGLYMTVITLTTLGYGEIPEPLSKPGRVFTMVLALGGIFVLFYIATDIIRSVVTGELRDLLGKERMDDHLAHLDQHLIVCGYGRMGKIICDELERTQQPFVAINKVPIDQDWTYQHGLRLHGDATDDETLRKAGIERAKALITAVGSDADNLYITLSARLLNAKLLIVARAEEEEAETKLRKVGANKVISPYLAGGHRAVQAVLKPTVLHFMEMATRSEFMDLQIEEIRIELGSKLAGTTLQDSKLSHDYGVIIVGLLYPNGNVLNAPTGTAVIEAGCTLIAIGRRVQLSQVEALAQGPTLQT